MKKKKANTKKDAWTHYWTSAATESSGCIPGAPKAVADLLQGIWDDFFDTLPRDGKLLDLGTGGGAVLKQAWANRPDLQLAGVDYATVLPELGNNITMHPNTSLERLPFADKSVDVITSQFALEYATLPQATTEIQRVLRHDGEFLFICHHVDSIIVHDNVRRLAAIQDLLAGSGLLNSIITVVKQKKTFDRKKQASLARLLQKVQLLHPYQPIVNEMAELTAKFMHDPGGLKKLLALQRDIEMEGRRISALEKSALNSTQVKDLVSLFSFSGYALHRETIYVPGTETPLAWKITTAKGKRHLPEHSVMEKDLCESG